MQSYFTTFPFLKSLDSLPYFPLEYLISFFSTEEQSDVWRSQVRPREIERKSTVPPRYEEALQSAAMAVHARRERDNAAPLLVNLGPLWFDHEMNTIWRASTWEEGDCPWESPPGLGLCPLDVVLSVCSRLHEHLSKKPRKGQGDPFAVLHARSCTHTSAQLVTFLATCHLIYSCGYDSVGNALSDVCIVSPNKSDTRRILPGQRRYCEYLICMLHNPELLPKGGDVGDPIVITTITFSKLSTFAPGKGAADHSRPGILAMPNYRIGSSIDGGSTGASTPRDDLSETDMGLGHSAVNAGRIMLTVYCRGKNIWTCGVAPGSVDEEADLLTFDLGRNGAGVAVRGDVILAIWFEDHKSGFERPAVAYAFHTAFVDCGDGGSAKMRVHARQLEVENQSKLIK